jgi:hypothetical protein
MTAPGGVPSKRIIDYSHAETPSPGVSDLYVYEFLEIVRLYMKFAASASATSRITAT